MTLQAPMTRLPTSRRFLGHAFLAACLLFGVSAQLLLKFATVQLHLQPGAWLSYFWIVCGLAVYALGTGFWVLCLAYLDLSYAYPFTGLTYVLVLGASWMLFDESASWQRLGGILVICLGVALIPVGGRKKT
jgi:multidrug transporter EmrE-like cation transporter